MELFIQQVVNGLSLGFTYALIAVGFTLVFGTLKILNYAQSAMVMICGYAAYVVLQNLNAGFAVALVVAALFGAGLGAGLERAVLHRVRQKSFLAPFILTLGVGLILEALAKQFWGTEPRAFPDGFPTKSFHIGGVSISLVQLVIAGVAIASMLLLGWFINRTRMGLMIRATAQAPQWAQISGVDTDRLGVWTMALAGALSGVAGILLAVAFGVVSPFVGAVYGLKGMVAMIVGGIGSLRGAVVAGVFIGLGEVMTVAYISSTWRDAIAFGALAVVLLWRPSGLFGREERFVPAAV